MTYTTQLEKTAVNISVLHVEKERLSDMLMQTKIILMRIADDVIGQIIADAITHHENL